MTDASHQPDQIGAPGGTLVIGTRGSKLALVQAEMVRSALLALRPNLEVRFEIISTQGDIVQDVPLSRIGGNGVFVRRIETALCDGSIDMAVHSAKDLPSALTPGMTIAAYLQRADARDVLVSNGSLKLMDLPVGARVGTSSPRRTCQIRSLRADLNLLDIRGNIDTRLRKLNEGQYDAIVLAAAGLLRLGRDSEITEWLSEDIMLPAVAQGALAVEVREDDASILALARQLDHLPTSTAVNVERAFLAGVAGSCALPVGAHATISRGRLRLVGMIGAADGRMIKGETFCDSTDAAAAGSALADDLLGRGGSALIAEDRAAEAQA